MVLLILYCPRGPSLILTAYGAAVAASCTLALGLGGLAKKIQPVNASPLKAAAIRATVPYVAVVGRCKEGCGGCLSVSLCLLVFVSGSSFLSLCLDVSFVCLCLLVYVLVCVVSRLCRRRCISLSLASFYAYLFVYGCPLFSRS